MRSEWVGHRFAIEQRWSRALASADLRKCCHFLWQLEDFKEKQDGRVLGYE
jgi:hypothetical protein